MSKSQGGAYTPFPFKLGNFYLPAHDSLWRPWALPRDDRRDSDDYGILEFRTQTLFCRSTTKVAYRTNRNIRLPFWHFGELIGTGAHQTPDKKIVLRDGKDAGIPDC